MTADLQAALKNFLLTDPAISQIAGLRISFDDVPSGGYPLVCIWCLSETPSLLLDGSHGLDNATYRFDAYSPKHAEVRAIRKAIKDRLHGFHGLMQDAQGNAIKIRLAEYVDGRSLTFMDAQRVYGWESEYDLRFVE